MITGEQMRAIYNEQVRTLAANGREWLKTEAAAVRAGIARQRIEGRKDGTVACLEGQLEQLRKAWEWAK